MKKWNRYQAEIGFQTKIARRRDVLHCGFRRYGYFNRTARHPAALNV
jgi:hypothetical protein